MTQRVVNYTYGTGNPVLPDGSIDVRDGIDNLQSFDIFMNADEDTYNQRDGEIVRTVSGMNNEFDTMIGGMNNEFDAQILNMGFTRVGTFVSGATLTNPRQTLLWDIADGGDGQEYGWSGTFLPSGKVVPPVSTPSTTGGIAIGAWISRFDPALQIIVFEDLRRSYAEAGYDLIGRFSNTGLVVNTVTDVMLWNPTGVAYAYSGVLPHTIGAGETPVGNPLWVAKNADTLRSDLTKPTGAGLVKFKRPLLNSILFPLSDLLEHSTVNAVAEAGADPKGIIDSTAAIHLALSFGYDVYLGPGRFRISGLLYPHFDGQRLIGCGDGFTEIFNDSNSEPLWCYGNPYEPTGAKQWAGVVGIQFTGNANTLWGIFNPNAALVDGAPNQSGQYEGVSSSANNFYHGRTSAVFSDWEIASRGSFARDISIVGVDGGFSLHCSAWGARFQNVRLWNGLDGLRVSGASNANSFRDFYISGMDGVSLIEPDVPFSVPTACTYENIIVQQSGKGTNNRAVELLKSQGSSVRGLYLERNNEKSATGDVFVGVACVGLTIESVRHRSGGAGPAPIVIENRGNGTYINSVTYSDNVVNVVLNSGTDTRTNCAVGVIATDGGVASGGEVVDTSTNKKLIRVNTTNVPVQLGAPLLLAKEISRGLEIRQGLSSSKTIDVVSNGSINFIIDAVSAGSGRVFKFSHDGAGGSETGLVEINDSAGIYPSIANTGSIGTASKPFSGGFSQAAFTVTSDERKKTPLEVIPDQVLDAWSEVGWGRYKLLDRIKEKGAEARYHNGVIAQRVVEAFERHGLSAYDYGLLCYDKWEYQPELTQTDPATYDEDGRLISPARTYIVQEELEAGDLFSVRYIEAYALEAESQRRNYQRLLARIEALEAK